MTTKLDRDYGVSRVLEEASERTTAADVQVAAQVFTFEMEVLDKPESISDASARRQAEQLMPTNRRLKQLAKNHPPAPEWYEEESPFDG